ncbi:taste receptor type 2 member 7-like [Dromiciops gliroides]|uniref:taste receptor type 2 member 7-like n=1 Tax=Dromiciops gliroides TaxID=33562 RepID=UPI001CC5BCAE|nr:taste receptor type 2 member 7-like [Dromiciops gliroides]
MSNTLDKICVTVVSGELLLGILANGFIGMMNCVDWVKTRKISLLNFILTGLAISRIGLLGIIASHLFFISLYPSLYTSNRLRIFRVMWTLANNSGAWFSACLSIFYFLKIANFSHPAFLWLKWRIDRGVLRVLLGCCFLSFLICLTVTLVSDDFQTSFDVENKRNLTQKIQEYKTHIFPILVVFGMVGIIPFALSMISCFLLILSLWRHTWKMQLNATSSRDPSMEAHVRVMKSMVSFLFLFVLYYTGMFSILLNIPVKKRKVFILLTLMAMTIYPVAHSIILIVGHNRLRLAALRVLWKLRIFFKG